MFSEICYIRLDFYEFSLAGPDGDSGECDTNENMKVTGHVSLSSLKFFCKASTNTHFLCFRCNKVPIMMSQFVDPIVDNTVMIKSVNNLSFDLLKLLHFQCTLKLMTMIP